MKQQLKDFSEDDMILAIHKIFAIDISDNRQNTFIYLFIDIIFDKMLCILQSSRLVGKFISNWKTGPGWTVANILLFYGSFYAKQCVYLLKLNPNINPNTHLKIFPFQGVLVWTLF